MSSIKTSPEDKFIKLALLANARRQMSRYDIRRSGNIAVDTVRALVNHYEGRKAIKEIHLSPNYYEMYRQYCVYQMKRAAKKTKQHVDAYDQQVEKVDLSFRGIPVSKRFMNTTVDIQWVFDDNKTGES